VPQAREKERGRNTKLFESAWVANREDFGEDRKVYRSRKVIVARVKPTLSTFFWASHSRVGELAAKACPIDVRAAQALGITDDLDRRRSGACSRAADGLSGSGGWLRPSRLLRA